MVPKSFSLSMANNSSLSTARRLVLCGAPAAGCATCTGTEAGGWGASAVAEPDPEKAELAGTAGAATGTPPAPAGLRSKKPAAAASVRLRPARIHHLYLVNGSGVLLGSPIPPPGPWPGLPAAWGLAEADCWP